MSSLVDSNKAASSSVQLPLGLGWEALKSPQMQGAVENNSSLLADLCKTLEKGNENAPVPTTRPPVPPTDAAASLAAALVDQLRSETHDEGELNSAIASLTANLLSRSR